MKKILFYLLGIVALSASLSGCSGINRLIKGGDPEAIYAKGVELYDAGKWSKAITLLQNVENYYSGTSKADTLSFYIARAHFKNRSYDTASELFDTYRRTFGRSPFIEDAEGMYAMCFYYLSPSPQRDQTVTGQAIVAISEFMSRYPDSEKYGQFEQMRNELTGRLHDKEFLNAYTYYKIGKHKSAIVALKNALRKYPETPHREELMYLIVGSGYELAHNSVQRKQTDRYLSMLDSYYTFIAEFPESTHRKESTAWPKRRRIIWLRIKKTIRKMEIKKNIPNNTITRKLVDLDRETGNIYETVNIIARRANQISAELKTELNRKLAEFSTTTDTLEETFENREQIEISRYYERLPKPAIIATEEFLDGELFFKEGAKTEN